MRAWHFLVVIIGFIGCSKPTIPKDILQPEKMQAVYWDYLRADIFANEYITRDSSLNDSLENAKLQLQVFNLHKITRQQFYKSYDYYLNHKELLKGMLDTMLVRQKEITQRKDSSFLKKTDTLKTSNIQKIQDTIIPD